MSFGMRITANDGSLLISQDSQNYRLMGPVACSAAANPASTIMEAVATHKCTFTSNIHPPLVYVDLPTATANGNGASIIGMTRSGDQYTVYVLAIGHTPSIYYATDFVGATAPACGMAIYDASGTLVWSNNDAMHNADFVDWSGNRVSTFTPNTLAYATQTVNLPRHTEVAIAGFCSGHETSLGNTVSNLVWITRPVYSLHSAGNNIFAYPATVKIGMAAPYPRLAVYDAATAFSFDYNVYYNTAQPVNRSFFLLR